MLRLSTLTPTFEDPANDPPSSAQYRAAGNKLLEVETAAGPVTIRLPTGVGTVPAYEHLPGDNVVTIAVQAANITEGQSPPIEILRFEGSTLTAPIEVPGDSYGLPTLPSAAIRFGTLYVLTADADGATLRVFPNPAPTS